MGPNRYSRGCAVGRETYRAGPAGWRPSQDRPAVVPSGRSPGAGAPAADRDDPRRDSAGGDGDGGGVVCARLIMGPEGRPRPPAGAPQRVGCAAGAGGRPHGNGSRLWSRCTAAATHAAVGGPDDLDDCRRAPGQAGAEYVWPPVGAEPGAPRDDRREGGSPAASAPDLVRAEGPGSPPMMQRTYETRLPGDPGRDPLLAAYADLVGRAERTRFARVCAGESPGASRPRASRPPW